MDEATYYVTQWRSSTGHWGESEEQQGCTDLAGARDFKARLEGAGYAARIIERTDRVYPS